MKVQQVGRYIRRQRENARLSLRGVSGLAGVSIPYLSQIERGLRRPSADILQAIAKALHISAATLYVQAGILEERTVPDTVTAVMSDPAITEVQKQALLQTYEAFKEDTGRSRRTKPARVRRSKSRAGETPGPGGKARKGV